MNSFLKLINLPIFYLIAGLSIVFVNVYFLPFSIWDAGVIRPWFMLNGYLPYHDFTWIRMPLDLFILSGWYKIIGVSPNSYQLFCFLLYSTVTVLLFLITKAINPKYYKGSFIFFIILLFPLFQNTEEGELLIGIINLLIFFMMYRYLKNQSLKYLFLLGFAVGTAFVTKQNSALVTVVSFVTIMFNGIFLKKTLPQYIKDSTVFFIAVLIPFLSISVYFICKGVFADFFYYTILFLLGVYSKEPTLFGDGLWIIASYIAILIPYIVFRKKIQIEPLIGFFLFFQIIVLFISLFPSYLSYRAFTSFPLVSIVVGYILSLFFRNKSAFAKFCVFTSFIIFMVLTSRFINPYINEIISGGFLYGRHLTSYGGTEYKIAELIKSKTSSNEKIIIYGSEMIYLLSNRFPKNKYIEPFPLHLRPYEVSFKVFTGDPPKIVVYDESLPADQPGLSDWPGIQFFRNNYKVIGRYNTIVVYEYNK